MATRTVPSETDDPRALATASLDRTRNGTTADQDGTLVSLGGGVFLTAGHVLFQHSNPGTPRPADAYHLTLGEGLAGARTVTLDGSQAAARITNFGWGLGGPDLAVMLTDDRAAPGVALLVHADPHDAAGGLASFGYPADAGGAMMVEVSGSLSRGSHREVQTAQGPASVHLSDGGMQVVGGQSGSGVWLASDPGGDGVAESRLAGIVTLSATSNGEPALAYEPLGDIYAGLAAIIAAAGLSADLFARATMVAGQRLDSGATQVTGTQLHEALIGGINADRLDGGGGDDILRGGFGNDRLIDGGGRDQLYGGVGADVFVLNSDTEIDQVRDFQRGLDRIDLSAWAAAGFSELALSDHHSGKVILRFGSETLTIDDGARGLRAADLRAADFVFDAAVAVGAVIEGTGGNDKLFGTAGDDEIFDFGGIDNLFGRAGADRFVLSADGAADTIKGFEDGVDRIDVSSWGAGFAALSIRDHSAGKVIVSFGDEVLAIQSADAAFSAAALGEDDFVFA